MAFLIKTSGDAGKHETGIILHFCTSVLKSHMASKSCHSTVLKPMWTELLGLQEDFADCFLIKHKLKNGAQLARVELVWTAGTHTCCTAAHVPVAPSQAVPSDPPVPTMLHD